MMTTTKKDYKIHAYGYDFIIPSGSKVTDQTACGADKNYHFWVDYHNQAEQLTGFKNSLLLHDLTYYGLNIPKEYCNSYPDN